MRALVGVLFACYCCCCVVGVKLYKVACVLVGVGVVVQVIIARLLYVVILRMLVGWSDRLVLVLVG